MKKVYRLDCRTETEKPIPHNTVFHKPQNELNRQSFAIIIFLCYNSIRNCKVFSNVITIRQKGVEREGISHYTHL